MIKFILLLFFTSILNFSTANVEISPKIVGGQDASPGQFPYMVSFKRKGYPKSHICGAGILNERWILTAAHCIVEFVPEQVMAVVGSVLIDEGGDTYDVERLIPHPRYVPPGILPPFEISINDIGLIKTASSIIFNEYVQPIPLSAQHVGNQVPVTLAGFGAYFTNITSRPEVMYMSRHLQFINTATITNNECILRAALAHVRDSNSPFIRLIDPVTNVCTLQPIGVGLCFGDSGSMLISNGEVVGIAVAVVRPCARGAPDILTRVSGFISWIEGHTQDLS